MYSSIVLPSVQSSLSRDLVRLGVYLSSSGSSPPTRQSMTCRVYSIPLRLTGISQVSPYWIPALGLDKTYQRHSGMFSSIHHRIPYISVVQLLLRVQPPSQTSLLKIQSRVCIALSRNPRTFLKL